jgi:WD40 repeat protein
MRKLLIFLAAVFLFSQQIINPSKIIKYNYYISKIAYNDSYLIAGLENGEIVIKDFNSLKVLYKITLPKIHDFMGDLIPMPIYSLDISPDNKQLLILAEGENAKRELFILNLETKKLSHIFTTKETLMKARYINNHQIFFGLLSDEVALFDLKSNKWLYKTQAGSYVFSTFALNDNKTKAAIGDESGSVKIIDIIKGKKINEIKGFNKDKTLSLDYIKNYIINASSDMRVAIYTEDGSTKTELKAKFLPYAAALNPSLNSFAIQYDEANNIMVYSIYSKPLYLLKGHTMALNGMKYLNKYEIISFSPAEIIIWKLK